MFNTYYNNRDKYVNVQAEIDINERRAPTDESVKLLMDMEDKALGNILASFKLQSNVFNARWHVMRNFRNGGLDVFCLFTLNGKEYNIQFELTEDRVFLNKPDFISFLVDKVRNALIEKISTILTLDLFETHANEVGAYYGHKL